MSELLAVVLVGLGTYLIRCSMVVALGRITLSAQAERALTMIPPAVLGALVAQTLLLEGESVRALSSWHFAAVVAAAVAWRTRSIGWTLAGGMAALWIIGALVG